uniref:Uncharacterized protein n=1 Tax=Meloidogyne enterolobii TaxID=390850 RepID=A0A6V7UA09_MELEN|nr:unnamed protein product [Meloidogyne enterolobii]
MTLFFGKIKQTLQRGQSISCGRSLSNLLAFTNNDGLLLTERLCKISGGDLIEGEYERF